MFKDIVNDLSLIISNLSTNTNHCSAVDLCHNKVLKPGVLEMSSNNMLGCSLHKRDRLGIDIWFATAFSVNVKTSVEKDSS